MDSADAIQRKSTGGMMPRKQLACRRGDFHKRVRETSSTPNSDSGPRFKNISLKRCEFILAFFCRIKTIFSSEIRETSET